MRSGLCSARTQNLLSTDQQNCIQPLFNQKYSIWLTTNGLVLSLCDEPTFYDFRPAPAGGTRVNTKISGKSTPDNRLTPIQNVADYNGVTLAAVPPLHHTKHRYSWICSLRSLGQESSHICGVTLLSSPPGPTVLVTSAHCVYICKNEEGRIYFSFMINIPLIYLFHLRSSHSLFVLRYLNI